MSNAEKNVVREWLSTLESGSKEGQYKNLSKKLHGLVARPSRSRPPVSLHKLNKSTKEGDNVVVPAKVLSTGNIEHKINIAALEYSAEALMQLQSKGCRVMNLSEMLTQKRINIVI